MFSVKTVIEQLIEERKKNIQLKNTLEKTSADLEYVAMMADIEIEDETENEEYGNE